MADVLPTLDIIKYYEEQGEGILSREERKNPQSFLNHDAYLEYKPLGTVLVISPWNYPLQLAMVPVITALAAGNTVVLKPSEVTPLTGELIQEIIDRAGLPEGTFQLVQGGGKIGQELIEAGPDKVFFTGSVETGKKVMEIAGRNLIPVDMELGGKDPMIVFEDADLDRAVEGAVYGAFANAGQLCVSVERLYVESPLYEEFTRRVANRAEELELGSGRDDDVGPMIYPKQVDVVEEHLEDARKKGANILTETKKEDLFFYPQVLTDVNHDMKIMTEETFGPVLPIMPFEGEKEAVELANDTRYGLNSSVWTEDREKAERVVSKLNVGNSYINDTVKNIGNPHLPFGGAKESGMGYYHGPEGLKRFTQQTSVMVNKNEGKDPNWFPYTEEMYETVEKLIDTLYGEVGVVEKAKNFLSLYRKMR